MKADTRIAIYFEHLFPESRGGGERLYGALATAWSDAGARVTYLTREYKDSTPVDRRFTVLTIADAADIYDASGTRSPAGALRFAGAAMKSIWQRRTVDDCVIVSSTPALLPLAARAGLALARDRIHIVDWLEVWTLGQWRDYLGTTRGSLAWVVQGLAIWSTPTATCHSALVEARLRRTRPGIRVLRSPGLVDSSIHPVGAHAEPAQVPPNALFVGRLIEDKNVLAVPGAISEIRRSIPDFHCMIVGDGPLLPRLEEEILKLGLGDFIVLRSGLTEEELAEAMASATCLLHPSQREGYGLVVVEAARYGTPSIVLDSPDNAAAELVQDGVNGFHSPNLTAQTLAEALLKCVQGGEGLRKSTLGWYTEARETRSMLRTAEGILEFISSQLGARQT